MRHQVPEAPVYRLFGALTTQASSGTVVLRQPTSPWLDVNNGNIELSLLAEQAVLETALTGAPPGMHARTVDLSIRYLRPCTIDDETVVARGRILHAGASFTTVEVLMDDALGRAVAHASGSVIFMPMDPPPPPLSRPLGSVDEPSYATPDPYLRPLPTQPRTYNLSGGQPAALPPMPISSALNFSKFVTGGRAPRWTARSGSACCIPTSHRE